jgi:hypothetical protein
MLQDESERMIRKKFLVSFLMSLFILTALINIASAATVEGPPTMPSQLREGDHSNFTIKISDYKDAKQITIETNLIPIGDKPLWDFGDANPTINIDRYRQNVTLDTSSLPSILTVSISGQVPDGTISTKCDDTFLIKLQETKLKFYEVREDNKLVKIESFDLIIKIKENFENTLQKVQWSQLNGIVQEDRKVFDSGLTTEAQNIADDIVNIKKPNSLLLFGFLTVDNNNLLNGIVFGCIIVMFILGYISGSRKEEEEEEYND